MLNIGISYPTNEDSRKMIEDISPDIKLFDLLDLSRRDHKGDAFAKKELDAILAKVDILFGFRLPDNYIARSPNLKWVQVTSAGVDRWLTPDMMACSAVLTNVSGIHAVPISEFVLEMMLMFVKGAPEFFELKQKHQWNRIHVSILHGKTVGVVGLGAIGSEVARLGRAFGMNVVATRRSAKPGQRARYVDTLLPATKLPDLLKQSDFVVIALPLTKETQNSFGEKELNTMKKTAYLINIGRGPIIDEPALIRALKEDRIAGAGLDVFSAEPLPPDNPLWDLKNVIMSHHVSGDRDDYDAQAIGVFTRNLKRFVAGKRLTNIVGKERGY